MTDFCSCGLIRFGRHGAANTGTKRRVEDLPTAPGSPLGPFRSLRHRRVSHLNTEKATNILACHFGVAKGNS